jgi:hypothetical protein
MLEANRPWEHGDMSFERFDIYFSGKCVAERSEQDVRTAVARLFKADGRQLALLFSGRPMRIKRAVDAETAGRYRASLRAAGALVDIRPSAEAAAPVPPDAPSTEGIEVGEAGTAFDLLPPRTGSLEDCAPAATAPPEVDIDAVELAGPGAILDESPAPPPADIATDHLSAGPPNAGTLEDCAEPKPARPLPDIAHLRIEAED